MQNSANPRINLNTMSWNPGNAADTKSSPTRGDDGGAGLLEVVDAMLSSSTIRDFHKNSFWQHHCDGTRKLYTNSGVHTVRSKKFEIVIAQTNSMRHVHVLHSLGIFFHFKKQIEPL